MSTYPNISSVLVIEQHERLNVALLSVVLRSVKGLAPIPIFVTIYSTLGYLDSIPKIYQ
jgi:hypothetical protein